jgi:hypothetical protein
LNSDGGWEIPAVCVSFATSSAPVRFRGTAEIGDLDVMRTTTSGSDDDDEDEDDADAECACNIGSLPEEPINSEDPWNSKVTPVSERALRMARGERYWI